jgi:2-hydroxy-3-oxopropionate reductase
VILGRDGVLQGAKNGSIIIDMSSIAPLVTIKISKEAEKKGVEMLDAPVSGGEKGAIQGTLAIMVGGKEEIFNKCRDIFNVLGKNITRVGDIGSGGFAKLVNQIIIAVNISAISEAFVFGKKAGLDPKKLYTAIRGGLAGSNILDAKIENILNGNFNPGFKLKLHRKDLNNVLTSAKDLNVPLPLTSIVQQIMISMINDEKGECDHSALINYFEDCANCIV